VDLFYANEPQVVSMKSFPTLRNVLLSKHSMEFHFCFKSDLK